MAMTAQVPHRERAAVCHGDWQDIRMPHRPTWVTTATHSNPSPKDEKGCYTLKYLTAIHP